MGDMADTELIRQCEEHVAFCDEMLEALDPNSPAAGYYDRMRRGAQALLEEVL